MNRSRMIIVSAVAIVMGLLASVFVYRQMTRTSRPAPVLTGHIVVAAGPLSLGARLEAANLRLLPWDPGNSVPGMFSRLEDCVDRVITASFMENEPILEGKLAPKDAMPGLPATIPEGMRALSVAVNEVVGVAGFVLPGSVVDVLVTGGPDNSAGGNSLTRTILERVRVLAAGQKIAQDEKGTPQTVPVITLLVTPEQANRLTMASTEGRIQLALRNTIDTKDANPPVVYRATLFGAAPRSGLGRAPAAAAQPPPRPTVDIEVIRGDKLEVVRF
jgi:pilus assembly protein CpaB